MMIIFDTIIIMAVGIVTISLILGKTKFWKNYIISNCKVSKEYDKIKISNIFFENVISSAYKSGFSLNADGINKLKNEITAKTPYTLASWGENIYIKIKNKNGGIEIIAYSICRVPFQIYDWKKNKKNVETFFKNIDIYIHSI